MDLSTLGRLLLMVALAIAAVGLVLLTAGALGIGRLPGDLWFGRGNVRVYAPIVTCVLLSVIATIVVNLISRR